MEQPFIKKNSNLNPKDEYPILREIQVNIYYQENQIFTPTPESNP